MKYPILLASLLGALLTSWTVRADDVRSCLEAHVSVQERRLAGDLLGAKTAAVRCSLEVCPALPRAECQRWGADLERELPTIAIRVEGAAPASQLSLTVDGASQPLGAAPLPVNPGDHSLTLMVDGEPMRRSVHLVAGQREQVTFQLRKADASGLGPHPNAAAAAPPPIGPIVLGSASLAGWIVFGVAGGLGAAHYDELADSCSPACSRAERDDLSVKLVTADVALGVASSLAAAAVIWLIVDLTSPSPAPTARREALVFSF